ncbi:MAG: MFS transporter [Polyangiaceae bacterium]
MRASTANDPAKEPLLTGPFVLAACSHFLHALAFNLYLHLSGFLKTLGGNEDQIGLIFGVMGASAILARPPMGRIMDQRGRRALILAGGVLNLLTCLTYTTVHSVGAWATSVRVVHGIAEAMLFTSLFAFASDIVPASRRFEGIALFGVSGMLPISIGSVLGDLILKHGAADGTGYRTLFLTSAALAGTALVLSLPLKEPPHALGDEPARGMWAAIKQPNLIPLWFGGVAFATCLAAPFTFFATFVMTEKIGSTGLYFSCYSLAAITLRIFFGKVPERVGPKRVLLPAMMLVGVGQATLAMAGSDVGIAIAGILSGMGHGYTFPIQLGLLVSRARAAERGAALAIFTALFDAGSMLGNPLFGHLVPVLGYRATFATSAVMMVVGTGVFAWMDRRNA